MTQDMRRLSDRILVALELANQQEDADIADLLARALELAVTRNAGGKDFVERREFVDEIEEALSKANLLKK